MHFTTVSALEGCDAEGRLPHELAMDSMMDASEAASSSKRSLDGPSLSLWCSSVEAVVLPSSPLSWRRRLAPYCRSASIASGTRLLLCARAIRSGQEPPGRAARAATNTLAQPMRPPGAPGPRPGWDTKHPPHRRGAAVCGRGAGPRAQHSVRARRVSACCARGKQRYRKRTGAGTCVARPDAAPPGPGVAMLQQATSRTSARGGRAAGGVTSAGGGPGRFRYKRRPLPASVAVGRARRARGAVRSQCRARACAACAGADDSGAVALRVVLRDPPSPSALPHPSPPFALAVPAKRCGSKVQEGPRQFPDAL
jgi:hypothetical protein